MPGRPSSSPQQHLLPSSPPRKPDGEGLSRKTGAEMSRPNAVLVRTRVSEWPASERPCGKLLNAGPSALSDAEVLSVLIGRGTRLGKKVITSVDIGRELLRRFETSRGISDRPVRELTEIPGIGPQTAARLAAAIELGRRIESGRAGARVQVCNPEEAAMQEEIACVEARDEITPALLAILREHVIGDTREKHWGPDDPRWYRMVHAGLLLMHFREADALPLFVREYRQATHDSFNEWFGNRLHLYGPAAVDPLIDLLHDEGTSAPMEEAPRAERRRSRLVRLARSAHRYAHVGSKRIGGAHGRVERPGGGRRVLSFPPDGRIAGFETTEQAARRAFQRLGTPQLHGVPQRHGPLWDDSFQRDRASWYSPAFRRYVGADEAPRPRTDGRLTRRGFRRGTGASRAARFKRHAVLKAFTPHPA